MRRVRCSRARASRESREPSGWSATGGRLRSAGRGGLAAGLLLAFAPVMAAQGTIAGTAVDSATHAPVAGVQIALQNGTVGTTTDASGRFRLQGVRGTRVTLIARRIGYALQQRAVAVGEMDVQFVMAPRAVSLDQVVVTGTPGVERQRTIGNSVTQIDAAAITQVAPIQSFQELINGRAPDVVIMPGSGQVGTGAKIRVRGTSSLGLAQEPLIYIDGVRTNNAQANGPANQAFGSQSISRWNDIDPEDIDRIEIIKGPSASTLYGTEAANGVMQVLTRQGSVGDPRYSVTVTQGGNFLMNPSGRFPVNYQKVGSSIETINFDQLQRNYGQNIFQTGYDQKYHGSISGGTDRLLYYLSGVHEDNNGAEASNNLLRNSAHATLTLTPSDALKVQTTLTYLAGHTNLSPEAGYGGTVWTTVLADPRNVTDSLRRGFYSGTPAAYNQEYHLFEDLNRFSGGLQVTHDPTSWFSQRLIFGIDQTNSTDVELYSRIDSLQYFFGSDALGFKTQTENKINYRTVDYSATTRFDLTSALNSATSVGGQYYRTRSEFVNATGSVFPAPGLTSIDATTQGRSTSQDLVENATLGFYAQEQLGWQDRRFLTLALRSDKNSAFGKNFGRVYYPKASLSWVVSDEPFWHLPLFSSLRLRSAYGESGQQPGAFDALRTYAPATGPNDVAAVTPLSLGNPTLGPERGKELEAGVDAGLLGERLALEFTYYNKRTTDAILDRQVAPSVGFASVQFVNAGEVRNTGVELLARVTPVRRATVTWDASVTLATNNNRIVTLLPGVTTLSAGTFREHRVGFPVGAWFQKKVVSAQLDSTGKAINIMCDDGKGGAIACANAPTVYLGSSIPNKEGAFTSTVTLWNRLKLYGLVDFQLGQSKLDGNLRVRCFFQLGGECRERFFPQEYDPKRIAGIQNRSLPGFLISDASFYKLRELSASYSLPDHWAALLRARGGSLTLAGRNLHTWTKYQGLEPEATFLSGSRGSGNDAWEQTILPQLSSVVLIVNLTY